jgi:hypothetical protein
MPADRRFHIGFRIKPKGFAGTFACALVVASTVLRPTSAAAQQAPAPDQAANDGNDLFRPPPNLLQMLSEYKTAPGSGSTPGSIREVTTDTLNLRFDHTFDLVPSWLLVLRGDLPLLAKNPITSDNPDGGYLEGIGDDESVAGDPTTKNISNLQLAPTFNLGLSDGWFVTFFPSADIRINFGDPITGQTGRLFLPFDARVGRKFSENTTLSLEVGVPIIKDYPVYDFKSQVRLNVTF